MFIYCALKQTVDRLKTGVKQTASLKYFERHFINTLINGQLDEIFLINAPFIRVHDVV